jgi:hypothetical protein
VGRLQTRFTPEYAHFREQLDNNQLLNFRAHLTNLLHDGSLAERKLRVLEVGGAVRFHIYVDKVNETLWLLGGHWLRQGEPSKDFMEKMKFYEAELALGREPKA